MTYTEYTPLPEEDMYYGDKIVIAFEKSQNEITGRGYDKKRDEVHESVSTLDSETVRIDCPLEKFYHKETEEELSKDEVQQIAQDTGFDDMRRTDVDTVEYDIDGETYVGVYDVSELPDL